jgi:hypothetical protein
MASVLNKLRPKSGFSYVLHLGFNALLPFLVFIFVKLGFAEIGLLLILLSKWRMLAVRPRYWLANIRSNGIDITVGISILIFINYTSSTYIQLLWVLIYILWLTVLKPASSTLGVSLQALIGQFLGLLAIFIWFSGSPLYLLIIATWVICYLAARHFFTIFEESFNSLYSHTWAYFAASLVWILGHWLLFYGVIAQPVVILTVISVGLSSLYYLKQNDRLSINLRRQIILIMVAALVIVLVFSNWSSKIV